MNFTYFIVILALRQWSGIQPVVSPRCACFSPLGSMLLGPTATFAMHFCSLVSVSCLFSLLNSFPLEFPVKTKINLINSSYKLSSSVEDEQCLLG